MEIEVVTTSDMLVRIKMLFCKYWFRGHGKNKELYNFWEKWGSWHNNFLVNKNDP
jgi:hypothetical protein